VHNSRVCEAFARNKAHNETSRSQVLCGDEVRRGTKLKHSRKERVRSGAGVFRFGTRCELSTICMPSKLKQTRRTLTIAHPITSTWLPHAVTAAPPPPCNPSSSPKTNEATKPFYPAFWSQHLPSHPAPPTSRPPVLAPPKSAAHHFHYLPK
jgi:hypothetical protein